MLFYIFYFYKGSTCSFSSYRLYSQFNPNAKRTPKGHLKYYKQKSNAEYVSGFARLSWQLQPVPLESPFLERSRILLPL